MKDKSIFRLGLAAWVIAVFVEIVILVAVVYVAAHFIGKWW